MAGHKPYWGTRIFIQNIEAKPVNLADLTLTNEEIEDSFMCREPLFGVILFLCFKLFIAVGNLAESKQLDIYAPRPVTDRALFYPIL